MTPSYQSLLATLYQADARHLPLADGTVHCCVTSPPYWQLRRYKDVDERCLGQEATVEEYLGHLLECFREVWRVLRDDGVVWCNLGETRGASGVGVARGQVYKRHTPRKQGLWAGTKLVKHDLGNEADIKDMSVESYLNRLGIPERFVLAMQADGWCWRDTVIWAKKSAMPESVSGTRWERCRVKVSARPEDAESTSGGNRYNDAYTRPQNLATWSACPGCEKCLPNDGWVLRRGSWRCTSAWEAVFMFVKGPGYYCDGEAVRTAHQPASLQRYEYGLHTSAPDDGLVSAGADTGAFHSDRMGDFINPSGANRRNVWCDISPNNLGGKLGHYATFPVDLPERCILASTSERGCCPNCGAQWARCVEPSVETQAARDNQDGQDWRPSQTHDGYTTGRHALNTAPVIQTLSWRPTCQCPPHTPVPALVLDPFAGLATTCVAAMGLGRRSVGIELSGEYLRLAAQRLAQTQPGLA